MISHSVGVRETGEREREREQQKAEFFDVQVFSSLVEQNSFNRIFFSNCDGSRFFFYFQLRKRFFSEIGSRNDTKNDSNQFLTESESEKFIRISFFWDAPLPRIGKLSFLKRLILMLKSQNFAMKIPWPYCVLKTIFSRRFLVIASVVFVIFLPNGRLEKVLPTPTSLDLNATLVDKLLPTCPKLFPKIFPDQVTWFIFCALLAFDGTEVKIYQNFGTY